MLKDQNQNKDLTTLSNPYFVQDTTSQAQLILKSCDTGITVLHVVTLRLKSLNTTLPPQGRQEGGRGGEEVRKGEREGGREEKGRGEEGRKKKRNSRGNNGRADFNTDLPPSKPML